MTRAFIGRRDEGFTFVELLAATAIFFIAFTALMSLMLASTVMTVRAKQRANMVNAANSYIEQVRGMNYDSVGVVGGTPNGSLPVHTATSSNGFAIEITPTVTWVDDPHITLTGNHDYKRLIINVRATAGANDPMPMSYSSETIIKPADSGQATTATAPTIDLAYGSPTDKGVVAGTNVYIGANAQANGLGVTLSSMNFYCDGVPLLDVSRQSAQWALNTQSAYEGFQWDTEALNDDGAQLSADGWHTLKAEAWDSNGKQAYVQWTVLVDNHPPNSVTRIRGTAGSQGTGLVMSLGWTDCYSGTSPCGRYDLTIRQQPMSDNGYYGWGYPRYGAGVGDFLTWWPQSGSTVSHATTTAVVPTAGLARYYYYVRSYGPPPFSRPSTSGAWVIRVTKPDVSTSSWSNVWPSKKKVDTTVHIKVGQPVFPYYSVANTLYRSTSPTGPWTTPYVSMGSAWTCDDVLPEQTGSPEAAPLTYYYLVETNIVPLGYAGGNHTVVRSQVIGPNGTTGAGKSPDTGAMTIVPGT